MLTTNDATQWMKNYAERLKVNKAYLTLLDAKVGDADHGINMDRGFKKVVEGLPSNGDSDMATILKSTGMALVKNVGGAAGPLYGTLFMRASQAIGDKNELDTADLATLFEAALEGVQERGNAEPGQKTMVDALKPSLAALQKAADSDTALPEAVAQATEAARQGMEDTIPMVAQKGRASYLGERSKGHQDPGATSTYLLLLSLQDVLSDEDIPMQLEAAKNVDMEDVEETEAAVEEDDG